MAVSRRLLGGRLQRLASDLEFVFKSTRGNLCGNGPLLLPYSSGRGIVESYGGGHGYYAFRFGSGTHGCKSSFTVPMPSVIGANPITDTRHKSVLTPVAERDCSDCRVVNQDGECGGTPRLRPFVELPHKVRPCGPISRQYPEIAPQNAVFAKHCRELFCVAFVWFPYRKLGHFIIPPTSAFSGGRLCGRTLKGVVRCHFSFNFVSDDSTTHSMA